MIIINAILSDKRVVFLGDKRPAGEVAEYVISAGYIAGAGGMVIPGITERLFPYTGLSSVDYLLSVPGYVAGVTNPVFEEQTGWWDILCNISTGKVAINRHLSANASSWSASPAASTTHNDPQAQASPLISSPASAKVNSTLSDMDIDNKFEGISSA